jgi:hypothetical protein
LSVPPPVDERDLLRRASAAWLRGADRVGLMPEPPDPGLSGVEQVGGKTYVVLRNGDGLMAVYRVRDDGTLKALRRVPAELRDG